MAYIIRSHNEAGFQPLFWTGTEVVGICRTSEAQRYPTQQVADEALAQIKPSSVRFYQLTVYPEPRNRPSISGHGWMVRHPGYDLMH